MSYSGASSASNAGGRVETTSAPLEMVSTFSADLADAHALQLPPAEDPLDVTFAAGPRDHEHPLLALAQHHLVRAHVLGAPGDLVHVDAHADPASGRDLARGAREPGGSEILNGLDRIQLDQLERRFH